MLYFISKRAKVMSELPLYKEKIKTDTGYKFVYDDAHLKERIKEKRKKNKILSNSFSRLQKQITKDLNDENIRIRAIAAVIQIIIDTSMRVGNVDSARDAKTYGATTLKVKHITLSGGKAKFKFPGKKAVNQVQETKNPKVIKVLKELTKNKAPNNFVFEIDGAQIWDRAINRYLKPFKISAKDLRAFNANNMMKKELQKYDWDKALNNVANSIGHEPNTLKNNYLDPVLVKKHQNKISKRAGLLSDIYDSGIDWVKEKLSPEEKESIDNIEYSNSWRPRNIAPSVNLNQYILNSWMTLQPFLPKSAIMTSGVRTEDDQENIINAAWNKLGAEAKYPNSSPEQKAKILTQQYNYIVSSPGKSPHQKGLAFDISGANLQKIKEAVEYVNGEAQLGVTLKPLVEHGNNAVHVDILKADYRPMEIAKLLLNKYNKVS